MLGENTASEQRGTHKSKWSTAYASRDVKTNPIVKFVSVHKLFTTFVNLLAVNKGLLRNSSPSTWRTRPVVTLSDSLLFRVGLDTWNNIHAANLAHYHQQKSFNDFFSQFLVRSFFAHYEKLKLDSMERRAINISDRTLCAVVTL